VDVIEAGFAFASPGDFAAVKKIAQIVGTEDGPVICSLARAIREDIKAAAEALLPAVHARIHVYFDLRHSSRVPVEENKS
jgi:2-isopropylmalate synthase